MRQPPRLERLTPHRLAGMGEPGRAWIVGLPELFAQLYP